MTSHEVVKAAADVSPPIIYAALRLFGMSLPDWVAAATLVYIALQAAHLIWRWWRSARRNSDTAN